MGGSPRDAAVRLALVLGLCAAVVGASAVVAGRTSREVLTWGIAIGGGGRYTPGSSLVLHPSPGHAVLLAAGLMLLPAGLALAGWRRARRPLVPDAEEPARPPTDLPYLALVCLIAVGGGVLGGYVLADRYGPTAPIVSVSVLWPLTVLLVGAGFGLRAEHRRRQEASRERVRRRRARLRAERRRALR